MLCGATALLPPPPPSLHFWNKTENDQAPLKPKKSSRTIENRKKFDHRGIKNGQFITTKLLEMVNLV